MHRYLTPIVSLLLLTAMNLTVKADAIMGSIQLTILGSNTPHLNNTTYSSGTIDLSTLPQNLPLPGPSLGYNNAGNFNEPVNTTFFMQITFQGPTGIQPVIDLTGPLVGEIGGTSMVVNMGGSFNATPTAATLANWSADSGVPLSLIDQYMNPASYHLDGAIEGGAMNLAGFLMTVNAPPVSTPEPAPILSFLVVIAGLGIRQRCRAIRC